jgi:glycosyltransferase involved in cell wall biosynthesis
VSVLDAVHVVVPARNEELLIGRCLDALARSRTALLAERPALEVRITVVLDGCVDDTATVVGRAEGVDAVAVTELTPGGARAAGVRRAAGQVPPDGSNRVWVACTDADSEVPLGWLLGQVRCAEQGFVCRVGAVHPELGPAERFLHLGWLARHELLEGHRHVFGANLGFALAAYEAVGGFAALDCGEDVDLVERFRAAGMRVRSTGEDPVRTSGRRSSRVRGGFADYLTTLASDLARAT